MHIAPVLQQNKLSRLILTDPKIDPISVLLVEDSLTVRTQLRHYLGLLEQVELVEATTIQALSAGALSIITKPKLGIKQFLEEAGDDIVSAVRAAAVARVRRLPARIEKAASQKSITPVAIRKSMHDTTDKVVAIGTSTGSP